MRIATLFILLSLCSLVSPSYSQSLLDRLDSALAAKPEVVKQKNQRIDILRSSLSKEKNPGIRLRLYERIYEEYYVYNFDKANEYNAEGLKLAKKVGDSYFIDVFTINSIHLLSISGLYSEAERTAGSIDVKRLSSDQQFSYHTALFELFGYWSDYCHDHTFSPRYRAYADSSLVRAMRFLPTEGGIRNYYMGEWATYVRHDPMMARKYYLKSLQYNKISDRTYAMACFALAGNYRNNSGKEGEKLYEKYMTLAAISDASNLTMENFALRSLAIFFYQNGRGDIRRARSYITEALNDAKFYNSRLRIIEISQDLPTIINHYQKALGKRNHNLKLALIANSVLIVLLLVVIAFIFMLNKRLNYSRIRHKKANEQLKVSYEKQERLNKSLACLNEQLRDTNRRREHLAKLFIDLCDNYISRLAKYQTLVKRKIKAGQVQQLLSQVTSSRLSTEDADVFYHRFDDAFLALYPTFVNEFNNLLRDGEQVYPKQAGTLTTDLRVFALIRLGVSDSSEISNLLFYSPQTIYNYRSQMKNRAKNRDTFEDDVRRLCTVMK